MNSIEIMERVRQHRIRLRFIRDYFDSALSVGQFDLDELILYSREFKAESEKIRETVRADEYDDGGLSLMPDIAETKALARKVILRLSCESTREGCNNRGVENLFD